MGMNPKTSACFGLALGLSILWAVATPPAEAGSKAQDVALRSPGAIRTIGPSVVGPPGFGTRVREIGGRLIFPPGSDAFIQGYQGGRPLLESSVLGFAGTGQPGPRPMAPLARLEIGSIPFRSTGAALPGEELLDRQDRRAIARELRALFRRHDAALPGLGNTKSR